MIKPGYPGTLVLKLLYSDRFFKICLQLNRVTYRFDFQTYPLKHQSLLQQTSNFASSFLIFEKNKVWYFMRIVCQQTILMKYHALFIIFEIEAKFENVVCCKL